jgi:hypothetical protein
MNRRDRLARIVPGADPSLIEQLAGLPLADVDRIVTALRQARRDAVAADKARRRQRKADDRRYGNYDESELSARNVAVIRSQGRRTSLDALAGLIEAGEAVAACTDEMITRLRVSGYPDTAIAGVMGRTSAAIGMRYGARRPRTPGGGATSTALESGLAAVDD